MTITFVQLIGLIVGGLVIIAIVTYVLTNLLSQRGLKEQKSKIEVMLAEAAEKARAIELEGRDKSFKILQDAEAEVAHMRAELSHEDERLQKRRTDVDFRVERLEQREQTLNKRQSALDKRANDVEKLYEQQMVELQRIGQMSTEEARGILLAETEKEARADMARIIRQVESEARAEGEKRARELVAEAIQRVASEHVAQVTTSVVSLPNEEMKGRIVGRNGRNIRAFEQAAGVDVIVDDTPEAVTISCFDPVRREVARRTLERLILDGRIHPAHIEKILAEEQRDVDRDIVEAGEQAAYEAGVAGLHPEILKMLGRLKFRTSYGQNQLGPRRGSGKTFCRVWLPSWAPTLRCQKPVVCCMTWARPWTTIRMALTPRSAQNLPAGMGSIPRSSISLPPITTRSTRKASKRSLSNRRMPSPAHAPAHAVRTWSNTSSGCALWRTLPIPSRASARPMPSRPAARCRIIVKPEDIDDLESARLARDIAKKIEETMQYPGQIKVTVIRETRAVEIAK